MQPQESAIYNLKLNTMSYLAQQFYSIHYDIFLFLLSPQKPHDESLPGHFQIRLMNHKPNESLKVKSWSYYMFFSSPLVKQQTIVIFVWHAIVLSSVLAHVLLTVI